MDKDWDIDQEIKQAADAAVEGAGVLAAEVEALCKPTPSKRVWIILGVIFILIAVAVLYVYQAGDRKTVLGNQPIPAVQPACPLRPVAQNVPVGGGILDARVGGGVLDAQVGGGFLDVPLGGGWPQTPAPTVAQPYNLPPPPVPTAAPPAAPPAADRAAPFQAGSTASCPTCGTRGLPLCSSCRSVMKPLANGNGLYACPSCGRVGLPICPRCGGHMLSPAAHAHAPVAAAQPNVGGQFQCPICRSTGLPNWTTAGVPMCPMCGARMRVTR